MICIKISHKLCDRMDWTQFWCFPWFPANSLLCVILRYTVNSVCRLGQMFLCMLSLVSWIRTIHPTNCQNKQGMTEDHCNALGCILEPRDVQRWYVQILPSLSGSGIILAQKSKIIYEILLSSLTHFLWIYMYCN